MVTSPMKRGKTQNTSVLFCMYEIYLLSEAVSSSTPKIEIERKKNPVSAAERQCTNERRKRETEDFCYFPAHRLFYTCVIVPCDCTHYPRCLPSCPPRLLESVLKYISLKIINYVINNVTRKCQVKYQRILTNCLYLDLFHSIPTFRIRKQMFITVCFTFLSINL